MARPKKPRSAELQAWVDRQLAKAPRAADDPERAARIARALGLGDPAKGRPRRLRTGRTGE